MSDSEPIYASFMNEEEWRSFSERHQQFLKLLPNLLHAMNIAFVRDCNGSQVDIVILSLGRTCLEEFMEILLLCGHGYGIAAIRSIRGMYERAVTAEYLHDHPEETEAFVDYHHVATYKLLKQVQATLGSDIYPPDQIKKIEEDYQRYRPQYLVTDCKKCGTQRVNYTWSKLDFVSMAAKTSLAKLLVQAYYLPTREIHSTIGAIFTRYAPHVDEGLIFGGEAQREKSDEALGLAHSIILFVLELQKLHFNLQELDQPFQQCLADYRIIYGRHE